MVGAVAKVFAHAQNVMLVPVGRQDIGKSALAKWLCSGIPDDRKQHHVELGAGHYGIFSGRRWRESIYPIVRDFIRDAE